MNDAKMVTGKPTFADKADSKSPTNQQWVGGKVNSTTPSGGEGKGLSSKQSSGKTEHDRMTTAPKVETLDGMPTVHTGGGKGSMAGVA
jgi:hypothetical protein